MAECGSERVCQWWQVGGRDDQGAARPLLRLADGASTGGWVAMPHNGTDTNGGQGSCAPSAEDCTPAVFLLFQYLDDRPETRSPIRAETFYLARLRGIDIDLGRNPSVSAVSMSSAQLASIEDVRVNGTSFHAGFNGLPGSGGFSANLEVEGGDYGVVQNQYRPNPSITGLRLVGQRHAGVVVDVSRGPLVVSGFSIEGARHPLIGDTERYRAVLLRNAAPSKDHSFSGEDGVITLHGASGGTAIETHGGDIVLKNVFVNGAETIALNKASALSLPSGGSAADPGPAVRVAAYVMTAAGGQVSDRGKRPKYSKDGAAVWLSSPLEKGAAAAPPWPAGTLPLLHSWDYSALPSWQSETLDVMRDYAATPSWVNATDDDGAKIQRAIDDACDPKSKVFGWPVFVPHGEFGVAQPLDLRGGCADLIGAGAHSTVLATLKHAYGGGCWASLTSLPPASQRGEDSSKASLALVSDFNVATPTHCPFIDLRAGKLLLRDVGTRGSGSVVPPLANSNDSAAAVAAAATSVAAPPPGAGETCLDEPFFALRGAVSGRFYGLALDGADLRRCKSSPRHLLLMVEGCTQAGGAIHIYQASTEHLINNYQTLINASSCGVHMHAWKYESALHSESSIPPDGSGSLVKIEGSSDVSVFGSSGNYHLFNVSVPIVYIAGGNSKLSMMGMTAQGPQDRKPTGKWWLEDDGSGSTVGGFPGGLLLYRTIK